MALWKASISFLITHGGLRKIWQKKIILCNLTKLMLFDVCWSQPCEDIFCFQTDSYSHGARTPTVSWVWGRGSPVPRPPDPSSLWWGSPCLRSVLEETTALPCPSQGPCLAGAKTALASWAWMMSKVSIKGVSILFMENTWCRSTIWQYIQNCTETAMKRIDVCFLWSN